MGIDIRFITMYGVSLNRELVDELYDYMDDNNIEGLHEWTDPDSGKMILGHTILKTESMRWDTPWGYEEIGAFAELHEAKVAYINKFMDAVPSKFWGLLEDNPWKIITFVQYR